MVGIKDLNKKLLLVIGVFILAGCFGNDGGSSNAGGNTPTTFSVNLSAPSEYPSGVGASLTMPVVVSNTGNTIQRNISYQIINNTINSNLTISQQSLTNCQNLNVGSSCMLNINIPKGSKSGSFAVQASARSNNISNQLANLITGSNTQTQQVSIGLTEQPSSVGIGVNGVSFYYDNVVYLPNNNSGVAIVTMVVNSANVGQFNTVVLLDPNGNPLENSVLTGNSGESFTNLTNGAVVSLAVQIPSGVSQLSFRPQLQLKGVTIANGTAPNLSTINVLRPNSPAQAIISMYPSYFSLSESNSSQVVTVSNSGTASAALSAPVLSPPLSIGNSGSCASSLSPGASCSYVVNLAVATPLAGTSSLLLNYNDANTQASVTSVINFRGQNALANLQISSSGNPSFTFQSSDSYPIESSLIKLTNSGSIPLTLGNINLPQYFSSSMAGVVNPCNNGMLLQANESCNFTLSYNNSVITNGYQAATMNIPYTYQGQSGSSTVYSGKSSISLTYSTLQSQASLKTNPSSVNFGNIPNNDVTTQLQTITITNIGNGNTTAAPQIQLIQPTGIFTIESTTCNNSLSAGSSCQLQVLVGPIPTTSSAGSESNMVNINYLPYAGAQPVNINVNLQAQVVTPQSAILTIGKPTNKGFVGGNGESAASAYALESGNIASITYKITNSGKVPATNFKLNFDPSTLLPWILTNTCGESIPAGGSCNAVYTLFRPPIGAPNLNYSGITMSWVDQASPNGQSLPFGAQQSYVTVFAPPVITLPPLFFLVAGGASTMTVTLNGGYNVPNQFMNLNPTPNIPLNPATGCAVSSSSPTCQIQVSAPANAAIGLYNVSTYHYSSPSGPVVSYPTSYPLYIISSGTWVPLPNTNFPNDQNVSLAINPVTGNLYAAYVDTNNGNKATVVMFNGYNWVNVGNPDFSEGSASGISLVFDLESNPQPYVVYADGANSNGATVMMFNGTTWSTVGNTNFTNGSYFSTASQLAFNPENNVPYVSYGTGSISNMNLFVSMFNASSNSWGVVGGGQINTTNVPITGSGSGIAFNQTNNQPYVAFQYAYPPSGKGTIAQAEQWGVLMTYNGSSWEQVGNEFFSNPKQDGEQMIFYMTLAMYNNQAYVAYTDPTNNSYPVVTVYNNTSWGSLGSPINDSNISELFLVFSPTGIPYLAYQDGVAMYSNNNWNNVGNNVNGTSNLVIGLDGLFIASGSSVLFYPNQS